MGGIFSPRKYTTVIPSTIKTRQDGGGMRDGVSSSSYNNGAAVKKNSNTTSTTADVVLMKTKKTKQLSKLVPRLDEDGNEMLLTLDQATKIVNRIIASSSLESNDSSGTASTIDDVNNNDNMKKKIYSWEDIGITDSTLLTNLQSSSTSSTKEGGGVGLGCTHPLPVQEQTCPAIIAMNDVLVSTHTVVVRHCHF
jgi:hypothetical protein